MSKDTLLPSLQCFFDERAAHIDSKPSLEQLCYVSGKDPRVWQQPDLYEDMMASIVDQLDLQPEHRLLEVGCAAGLLALGLAPQCKEYVGIDLAAAAIDKAKTLKIPNAQFRVADARNLPFKTGSFDRVVCYDVLTNFDSFEIPSQMIKEMIRVVTSSGKVLVGSIPDDEKKSTLPQRISEVDQELTQKYGPLPNPPARQPGLLGALKQWWRKKVLRVEPQIVCYYFRKEQFENCAKQSAAIPVFQNVHKLHPYAEHRFNVIYQRAA